jgi:4'-phosphopantetheinyl transferase
MTTAHTPEPCSDVQLWVATVAELEDPNHAAASWAVLSPGEKRHAERFYFERDRNSFLTSRSLRRHVLSHYAAVEPKQWQFTANQYGRPRIAFPLLDEPLEFNTSKCGDLVVCAVTRGLCVGVDIERLDRSVPEGVAESTFAPGEIAALQLLPLSDRDKRFFTLWTLKEAYVKARGMGLSMPLDSVAFNVTDTTCLQGHLESLAESDCDAWHFTLHSPTPSHIVAVCIPRQRGFDPHIVMRRVSAVRIPQ